MVRGQVRGHRRTQGKTVAAVVTAVSAWTVAAVVSAVSACACIISTKLEYKYVLQVANSTCSMGIGLHHLSLDTVQVKLLEWQHLPTAKHASVA